MIVRAYGAARRRSTKKYMARVSLPVLSIALAIPFAVLGASSASAQDVQSGATEAQPPAQTQKGETPVQTSDSIQDIVVTAQLRSQNVQQTPLAITAVTGDMLRERGSTSVTDLSNSTPSVTLVQGTGIYSGVQAFIRGVGQADFQPAKEPGVGMYLDDVYYGNLFGSDFELLDIDRVEVLRGPQGTLSGANSEGGSVKIYTKKPTGNAGGYVEAGYGSNQKLLARGAFDVPIVKDKLFLRVSGGIDRDNGYVNIVDFTCSNPSQAGTLPHQSVEHGNCVVGKAGGRSSSAVRAAVRWLPTDRLEINLSADGNFVKTQPSAEQAYAIDQNFIDNPANPPSYNAPGGVPDSYGIQYDSRFIPGKRYITYSTFTDLEGHQRVVDPNGFINSWGYTGTIDYDVSSHISLKSISALRYADGTAREDQDASPLNYASPGEYDYQHRQFTQELRLSAKLFNGFLDTTVGGFYYRARDGFQGLVDVQGVFIPFGGLFFQVDDVIHSIKKSGFVTATIHPTDKLNITGGYRYTDSSKSYKYGRYDPDPPSLVTIFGLDALNALPPVVSRTKRSDYRAAIDYQWTPTFMTYAQFATGFKDAGVNPTPTTVAQVVPFQAETLKSYEAGVKTDLFDRHLRFDLTGFISKYQNLQLKSLFLDSDGFLDSLNSNAGSATIKGIEAEAELRPLEGLLLTGSFSYLDFKYNDLGAAGDPANGASRPCLTCTNTYTPKYQMSYAAQYKFDLGGIGSLTPRIDANYRSKMFAELSNSPLEVIHARWLANARLTWNAPDPDWEVVFSVTNLFNKFYYSDVNDFLYETGVALGDPGRPREFMLSARRSF